MQKHGR